MNKVLILNSKCEMTGWAVYLQKPFFLFLVKNSKFDRCPRNAQKCGNFLYTGTNSSDLKKLPAIRSIYLVVAIFGFAFSKAVIGIRSSISSGCDVSGKKIPKIFSHSILTGGILFTTHTDISHLTMMLSYFEHARTVVTTVTFL